MKKISLLLISLGLAFAANEKARVIDGTVTGLPNPLASKIYSGYYNVSTTRQLHYLLVESIRDPAKDPVVVWFSGGPGASSTPHIGLGHGPYLYHEETNSFTVNPDAWNNETNMLYVDNPAGVSYSYAERDVDYSFNDDAFSKDAMVFLKQFFEDWKEWLPSPLFISGQSYGGIYAPYMTWTIHQHNQYMEALDPVKKAGSYNLKGYIMANGITDFNFDGFIP